MNRVFSALMRIAIFVALIIGIGVIFGNTPEVKTAVAFLGAAVKFIVGNMKNMAGFFPIWDLTAAFSAFIVVEIMVFVFKTTKSVTNVDKE